MVWDAVKINQLINVSNIFCLWINDSFWADPLARKPVDRICPMVECLLGWFSVQESLSWIEGTNHLSSTSCGKFQQFLKCCNTWTTRSGEDRLDLWVWHHFLFSRATWFEATRDVVEICRVEWRAEWLLIICHLKYWGRDLFCIFHVCKPCRGAGSFFVSSFYSAFWYFLVVFRLN